MDFPSPPAVSITPPSPTGKPHRLPCPLTLFKRRNKSLPSPTEVACPPSCPTPSHSHSHMRPPRPELARHPSSQGTHRHFFTRSRAPSLKGIDGPLTDATILTHFDTLHAAILTHLDRFYASPPPYPSAPPLDPLHPHYHPHTSHSIENLLLPWPETHRLLSDEKTRLGALGLCVSWTVLSRSLLLKLGVSGNPGSTFLPPEIVECFQSFSVDFGGYVRATMGDACAPSYAEGGGGSGMESTFALLSTWKQISATLMQGTYVQNPFSHFDSRTMNIERAINDLDPLLRSNAKSNVNEREKNFPQCRYPDPRLEDLRNVFRMAARFAFLLFSQPTFWMFDWSVDAKAREGDMVVWPCLIRILDGEGRRVDSGNARLGRKKYLSEFEKRTSEEVSAREREDAEGRVRGEREGMGTPLGMMNVRRMRLARGWTTG